MKICVAVCFPMLLVHAAKIAHYVEVPGLGTLRGTTSNMSNAVALFGGIPYAKSPQGALRWQPPEPHGPWQGVRDASSYGASCWQRSLPMNLPMTRSEDCLFLNVAAPVASLQRSHLLPVMFWIHGGGYEVGHSAPQGTAPKLVADIVTLVSRSDMSVVSVSINYRLAVFGFLASKELQSRARDGSTGNFGIQDQRLAMKWVKQHIFAFGGNGEDITIFGQSAGGHSVLNHLVQTASFDLYTKAIIQSGTYDPGSVSVSIVEPRYQALLNDTRCKDVECLLRLPAEQIFNATTLAAPPFCEPPGFCANNWAPVIDGVSLTDTPYVAVSEGRHNRKVPLIIGSNRDEQASPWWAPFFPAHNMTEADFDKWFAEAILPRVPRAVLFKVKEIYDPRVYPFPQDPDGFSQWWWTATRIWTDQSRGFGACGVRSLARAWTAAGSEKVYTYLLAHPVQTDFNPAIAGTGLGSSIVGHGSELPFTFGAVASLDSDAEVNLALNMSAYWIAFVKSSTPRVSNLPSWPKYTKASDTLLSFDASPAVIQTQQEVRKRACNYWDDLAAIPDDGSVLEV